MALEAEMIFKKMLVIVKYYMYKFKCKTHLIK